MKISLIGPLILICASPAFAVSTTYDCMVEEPKAITLSGNQAIAQVIEGLPAESLRFQFTVSGESGKVDWKNSPIQMSGENPIFRTGDDSGSVLFLSGGPCLFTSGACGSMLNFSKKNDGNLVVLITPTAFTTDSEINATRPFLVAIEGSCVLRKGQK